MTFPTGRFVLESVDVLQAMHAMRSRALSLNEAMQKGASEQSIDPSLPEARGQGLAMMDTQRKASLERYAAFRDTDLPDKTWLFAEDLLIGYSVDIKRADKNHYLSLTHRAIDYKLKRKAGSPPNGPIFPKFAARDEAFVVPPVEKLDDTKLRLSDTVFTWAIDPPALPGAPSKDDATEAYQTKVDALRDLAVGFDIGLSQKVPVLREGNGYRIGFRARLINGRSISHADAEARYQAGDGIGSLGGTADYYFPYQRDGQIPAPDLLIPSGEPVLDRASPHNAGESANVIVVRAESGPDQRRRVLMPPRASFEDLECAGALDELEEDIAPTAFPEVDLASNGGYHPAMRSGATDPIGLQYALQLPFFEREFPFYPHPHAQRLMAAFVRNGATPISYSDTPPILSFRKPGKDYRGARAIVLEVNRWSGALRGGRFDNARTSDTLNYGIGPDVGVLSVHLAPAEEIELYLWSQDDAATLCRTQRFAWASTQYLAVDAFDDPSNPTPQVLAPNLAAGEFTLEEWRAIRPWEIGTGSARLRSQTIGNFIQRHIETATQLVPIDGLTPVLKLKLVHTVERPRRAPSRRGLTYTSGLTGAVQGVLQRNEGDRSAKLVGTIDIDSASTSNLVVELRWREVEDRLVASSGEESSWSEFKRPDFKSFVFDGIPRSLSILGEDVPNDRFDLAIDEAGRERGQICAFADSRARRVSTRLVATSRYVHYYQQPDKTPGAPGKAEPIDPRFLSQDRSSTAASALLDTPGWRDDGPSFWLLSTLPPPRPEIDRVVHERRPTETLREGRPSEGDGRITVDWRVILRCYLKPGSWFASGEDELLAVVCTPGNLVDNWPATISDQPAEHGLLPGEHARSDTLSRTPLSHFDTLDPAQPSPDDDRKLSPYIAKAVTRWAMDATAFSPVGQSLIPPSAFSGYVAKRANLKLPPDAVQMPPTKPGDDPVDRTTLVGPGGDPRPSERDADKVAIIAYRPLLNPRDGRRYVDISFDPGASQDPFVELGLARYQPHSLNGIELSQAVVQRVGNVPSPRRVDIVVKDGLITVEVRGAAYTQREPAIAPRVCDGELRLEDFDRPICEVTLRRRPNGKQGGRLVVRPDGEPERTQVFPVPDGPLHLWRHQLPLPADGGDYEITIREMSRYAVASVSAEYPGQTVDVPNFFAVSVAL